jgi:hypothetical protein
MPLWDEMPGPAETTANRCIFGCGAASRRTEARPAAGPAHTGCWLAVFDPDALAEPGHGGPVHAFGDAALRAGTCQLNGAQRISVIPRRYDDAY